MTPGSCIGKYRLVRRLGHGAMGEVWEAENVDTDRAVALKLITSPDPELRRRLLREARAIGRLEHPNIVQILDRGETDTGEPFLVMQLLRGETLADRLRREGTLPPPVAAAIALDVARALRAAHEKQIVHRDLKPPNIFLHAELDTEEHVVKVVDFGVSKLSIDNEGGATLAGGLVGSPAYMSPEQIRSQGVDGRTDVWAVGVLLFEMIAGVRPFHAEQSVAVLTRIISTTAPRVETVAPHVPTALGNVIAACLERDTSLRVQSAEELIRLLRPFAPRSRMATLQDAAAVERFASIPDAPRSDAGHPGQTGYTPSGHDSGGRPPLPSYSNAGHDGGSPPRDGQRRDRESDATTTVFQPDAHLKAIIASPQPPPRALTPHPFRATTPMVPQAAPTGTVLMAPRPAPPAPPRDTATALYSPPDPAKDPPSVDDERPTAEIKPMPRPLPRDPPKRPAPPAPPPPRMPMASDPHTRAPISEPRAMPPSPPQPSFDFGSGSWPEVGSPAAQADARPQEQRAFGGTQPLSPAMVAALPPPPDPRKATLKLDPNIVPQSPMAPVAMGPLVTTGPTPPLPPLPTPVFDLPEPAPPRRGLPLVLLGVSALALAIVLTMLVMTLADGRAPAVIEDAGAATNKP